LTKENRLDALANRVEIKLIADELGCTIKEVCGNTDLKKQVNSAFAGTGKNIDLTALFRDSFLEVNCRFGHQLGAMKIISSLGQEVYNQDKPVDEITRSVLARRQFGVRNLLLQHLKRLGVHCSMMHYLALKIVICAMI
jgi:hypothetical protein